MSFGGNVVSLRGFGYEAMLLSAVAQKPSNPTGSHCTQGIHISEQEVLVKGCIVLKIGNRALSFEWIQQREAKPFGFKLLKFL